MIVHTAMESGWSARFWLHDIFHPLHGLGATFWSGIGSDVGELAVVGFLIGLWRKVNCSVPWCLRLGKHRTADGKHKLCRRHHPDHPKSRPGLDEIVKLHEAAKKLRETNL